MEVLKAEVLGFCFGVRRAVELATKALQNPLGKVYSLGPLIHNEYVLETLAEQGLEILEEKDIFAIEQNSTVIIRAHGVSPKIVKQLEKKKCKIIDATCPKVRASQKLVEKHSFQNDFIFLSGDNNHGEVQGIAGYAGENFKLIQNPLEAENLDIPGIQDKNLILISQTTFSTKEFDQIEKNLRKKYVNLNVKNTICSATSERQQSLIDLCKKVEGILVIGGKSSANTKRLYQIALENCTHTALIQQKEDIPAEFFSLKKVGITAGASTPDSIIEQVEKALEQNSCSVVER